MKLVTARLSSVVTLLFLAAPVFPQENSGGNGFLPPLVVRFQKLGIEQGLSQASVQAIAQDSSGFLWFGTENGLNRYDGYSFTVFRHNPSDSFSISDNYIWRLLTSRTGDLWIATLEGGLDRYETATGRFVTYRHDPHDSTSLSYNNVTGLFEDKKGSLWVGTWGGGLCRLDSGRRGFVCYRHMSDMHNSLGNNFVSSIREDNDGNLWIGTWNGVTRIDSSRTMFRHYRYSADDARSLSDNMVWDIMLDRTGELWIATRNGLNRYDRNTDRFVRYTHDERVPTTLNSNIVSCFLEDSRGGLWVGTQEGGLNSLDRRSGSVRHLRLGNEPAGNLSRDNVLSVFEDRMGTLWFGTTQGIFSYDPGAEKFHLVDLDAARPLADRSIRCIGESRQGGIWVGTNGEGLLFLPGKGERESSFRSRGETITDLSSKNVLAVLEQRDGTLWVGTQHGLNRVSPRAQRATRFLADPRNPASLSDNSVITLLEDRQGVLWIGTNGGGLESYDPSRKVFVHHRHSSQPGSISGNWIWSLHEDRLGALWVGTWTRGLNRFDPTSGSFVTFAHDPGDETTLSNNTVLCIQEDDEGNLWVGTLGGGLNRFDPATKHFTHYTEKNGLCSDVVVGILPDGHGNLWLSTYKGVSCFTPGTGRFKNYDVSDGLQSNEFNQGAYCRMRDGTMLFGGVAGLNLFYPDSIRDNPTVPPVVITAFKVFEEPVDFEQQGRGPGRLHLTYRQNFFSIEFAALNFRSPHKNAYAYMLDGLERQWVDAGNRRVAYYTNVPPGEYTFRARGANNDGIWNEKAATVTVLIEPPYWETTLFRLFLGIAALAVLFTLYRFRMAQVRRRELTQREFSDQLLASQEQERSRIAGELHDSLVQNLLVAKNRSLIGLKKQADASLVRRELEEIASAVTLAIDEVREIAHNLRPYQLDRLGLTKAIQSLLATLDGSSGIVFKADLDAIDDKFPGERSILLYRIVQEGTNNILRHSKATAAFVAIKRLPASVELRISDNGQGFPQGVQAAQGFGLSGMAQRARMLDGKLTVTSVPGVETTIHIDIPLKEIKR